MASFFAALLFAAVRATGDIAFEDATASSTYSAGNLYGNPEHAATRALSAGSGYWCSAGGHEAGETVAWQGKLAAPMPLKGVEITWAHAPEEIRVLTSPDGSNFEEAICFRPTGKVDESFTETLLFSGAMKASVVMIVMKGPRASGYFGIGEVSALTAAASPVMFVSGATSEAELCMVVENGAVAAAGALVALETCGGAIASGDGRDLFLQTAEGQLKSAGGLCVVLAANSPVGGGVVHLEDCHAAAAAGDGRSFWSVTASAQVSMARGGGYCLTLSGDLPTLNADVAGDATATATAAMDSEHAAAAAVDGDASTYWAAEAGTGPVALTLELKNLARVKAVVIEWQAAAKSFEVQVASDAGPWGVFASVAGNALTKTTLTGASAIAKKVRVIMSEPGTPEAAYGIAGIKVLVAPLKLGVADCSQASQTGDARDKFFAQPVPEFDPRASAPIKAAAPLLASSLRDLGAATSELVVSLPKLEACSPSFLQESAMISVNASRVSMKAPAMDVVDEAIAAIAEESTASVAAFVSAATSALAPYESL